MVITGGGTGLTYEPDANYCNTQPGGTPGHLHATRSTAARRATVSVTVTCVDDPPIAVNDSATVAEDAGATAIDVLANDTDVDGGPMSVGSVTQPANGTVVITGGGTGLTYQPDAELLQRRQPGDAPDTFTYTLTRRLDRDGLGHGHLRRRRRRSRSTTARRSARTPGANAIDVLANDTDTDGGPKSVDSVVAAGQRHGRHHRRRRRA